MSDPTPDIQRKTVSLTHKQLGVGGGILVAMMGVGKLKEIKEFFTGEQAAAIVRIETNQTAGFAEVKALLSKHIEDESVAHRRMRDLDREDVASSEARCKSVSDEIKLQVRDLQSYAFKLNTRKGLQN